MEAYADLHSHTTASDGTNAPADNVRKAAAAGLAALAITDHDTVAGIDEALEEGRRAGIEVVPGVEISTVAGGQDIHVLGYYMDYRSPQFLARLHDLRDTRDRRNEMIIARLQELGMNITLDEVAARVQKSSPDETIGRPHIADTLLGKGYVSSMQEAFDLYLGKTGQAFVNPPRIRPEEAIDWIRDAGGCVILAHPGLYGDDELVKQLIGYGIDGIEVYHSEHSDEDERRYLALTEQHGLIATGGSDYHGEREGVAYHGPLGARKVDTAVIQQLQQRSSFLSRQG